jgi:hypothetical protein
VKLFTGYRPVPPEGYKESGLANDPDQPQSQGVVFDDGSVTLRWMTAVNSTSFFESYAQFYKVHGHPEYGTRIEWLNFDYDDPIWEDGTEEKATNW